MPIVRALSAPGAVTLQPGRPVPSKAVYSVRLCPASLPCRFRVNLIKPVARSRQAAGVPLILASASGAGASSFHGTEPCTDAQPSQQADTESCEPAAPSQLKAVPQAVLYTLLAGATCLWWLCNSNAAAGGALFAAATVAAKPASMFLAAKSAWAGLIAGGLHTLAGPDHLAALTPLSIGRSRAAGALLGSLWGLGHSAGQLLLGLMMVLLKDKFNAWIPAIEVWGSTFVGMTLIAIGVVGIKETFFSKDDHHQEEEEIAALAEKSKDGKTFNFALATFGTGILHGLQPDALFVIIPALALPTKAAAAAYILMFVFGTCAAMGGYTALIGHTMSAISKKDPNITRNVAAFASAVAMAVGLLILLPGWGVEIPWSPI